MTDPEYLKDEGYMRQALAQAKMAYERDEVPVGAVIVFENQIIAKAHNLVETLKDPTAHAEMIAVTQAVNTLKTKWLNKCTMYITVEPCSMCAGALVLARISKLIFATEDPKTGACGSLMNIAQHNSLNHHIDVQKGILRDECSLIMKEFFKQKRHTLN
ncbi:MAG: tRNA adenosine(34) deaminase TadA [Candidatus Omnitrophica bacterium]|nr:tRNA adenosine(34) deaminase TadA [Candidatus Omnitrophota bacterium]